jgi:hypothetical protein
MPGQEVGPLTIKAGDRVVVRTAGGQLVERRAISGQEHGRDFLVVRVCDETEWEAARRGGREPEGIPWPAEDVGPAEPVSA